MGVLLVPSLFPLLFIGVSAKGAISGASGFGVYTVKKGLLTDVANGDKWLVNNRLDHKPKSPDDIVKEAELLVGKEMPYNLITNNCEHLITNLRYGKPESRQVRTNCDSHNGSEQPDQCV